MALYANFASGLSLLPLELYLLLVQVYHRINILSSYLYFFEGIKKGHGTFVRTPLRNSDTKHVLQSELQVVGGLLFTPPFFIIANQTPTVLLGNSLKRKSVVLAANLLVAMFCRDLTTALVVRAHPLHLLMR
jgi:hypothetical protein